MASSSLKLYKGVAYPLSRTSEFALYDPEQSSMDEHGGYDQQDAEGLIKINAVRLKQYSIKRNTPLKKPSKAA